MNSYAQSEEARIIKELEERAELGLDDLSKFLRTDIIPAGTDCGKSTILLNLLQATQKEELKND